MSIAKYRKKPGNAPYRLGTRESRVIEAAKASSINVVKVTLRHEDLVDGEAVDLSESLPKGTIVQKVYSNVTEAFAGDGDGSSTVSLGLNSAADVQAAADVASAPWSTIGMKAHKDGAAANMISLTADRKLTATLSIETTDTELTAGEAVIYVEYVNG